MKLRTTVKERFNKFLGNVLRKSNNKGFTLLEILVVLTIMGFLLAMLAPRLGGVSNSAVDTVCDSNQSRTIQMVGAYFEKTNRFPDKMTNLVAQNGTTAYVIPQVSDDNPDNGKETLASEFASRVKPVIHHLSTAEVNELKAMGVANVFNLNDYSGVSNPVTTANQQPFMNPAKVAAGVGVMMSGIGATNATADFTAPTADLSGMGEADFYGRIVMGLGPESGLVTSGLITNAGHCPGGLQNSDNVTYNDYNIVLPRLQATVDRVGATPVLADVASAVDGIQLLSFGYTEDTPAATAFTATVATDGTITALVGAKKARLVNFTKQENHQYATMCPEGHMFPANDADFFALDLDGTAGASN